MHCDGLNNSINMNNFPLHNFLVYMSTYHYSTISAIAIVSTHHLVHMEFKKS